MCMDLAENDDRIFSDDEDDGPAATGPSGTSAGLDMRAAVNTDAEGGPLQYDDNEQTKRLQL